MTKRDGTGTPASQLSPYIPITVVTAFESHSCSITLLTTHQRTHRKADFVLEFAGYPFRNRNTLFRNGSTKGGVRIRNGVLGVHFLYNDKRQWSGDAYIQLENEKEVEGALSHNEGQMNHRYLEIFRTTADEMDSAMKRSPFYRLPNDYAVRLRGLEYRVTKQDIRDFFQGLDIASGLDGIYIVENQEGRPTGEAYVMFENKTAVEQAAQKHKEKLGQRYVEIFLASSAQIRDAREYYPDDRDQARGYRGYSEDRYSGPPPGPPQQRRGQGHYGGGQGFAGPQTGWFDEEYRNEDRGYRQEGNGHQGYDQFSTGSDYRLFMRGLPWVCTERDIEQFFSPTRCSNITKNMSSSNVFDGSAWVEFESEVDYEAARKKHKTNMGHRYVELFTEEEVDAKRLRTNRDRDRTRAPPPPPARRTHSPSPRRGGRGGGRGRGGSTGGGMPRREEGNNVRRDADRRPSNSVRQDTRPQGNQRGQQTFTYVPTVGGMNTRPVGRQDTGYGLDNPQQIPVSYGNFGSPMGQMGGSGFLNNNSVGLMSVSSSNFESAGRFVGDMQSYNDQMFQQNIKPLGNPSQGYNSLLPAPHMPFHATVSYP